MADAIHGAEAYIVPRKVDNTYRNMFEDLCKSPQIQHIRTVLHNSRATFGESGEDNESGPPEAEPPPRPPPTGGKLKTAVKQPKGAASGAKSAKSAVRFEVEEAIKEAKLLSSEKKAKKAATPFSQKSHSSFVTARSGGSEDAETPTPAKSKSSKKSSSKKAEKQAATPRALETAFEGVAPTPKLKGIPKAKGLNMKVAEAKAAPAPEAKAVEVKAAPASAEKAETSKAAKINAFVSQTAGANRIVTIVQATGRGGKGSRPAYVGHDGVPISYLDSDVSIIQLNKMIDAFNRVKAKIPDADKAAKRDISSYISRIKAEITKRG
jgi:hypothetical protein